MKITLLDFSLIIVIGHCLYLITSIQFIPESNKKANTILQYLLGIYCCIMLEGILLFRITNPELMRYRAITTAIYFLIGPLIYTYFRRLLFARNSSFNLGVSHYVPASLFFIYSMAIVIYYDFFLTKHKSLLVISYALFEFLAIISIQLYLYKSYRVSKYFELNEKQELSYNQTISRYIRIIIVVMTLCLIAWFISAYDRYINRNSGNIITDFIWLLFGAQAFIVSHYSLKSPVIFKIKLQNQFLAKNKEKDRVNKKEINRLNSLINTLLEEKKLYRQQDINLALMAKELSTSPNNLSWVLNNVYNKTFYQLINEYRVNEFKARIRNNEHKELTLISIANDVGFKSKSTFYKAFKEIANTTPTEYIKNLNKN